MCLYAPFFPHLSKNCSFSSKLCVAQKRIKSDEHKAGNIQTDRFLSDSLFSFPSSCCSVPAYWFSVPVSSNFRWIFICFPCNLVTCHTYILSNTRVNCYLKCSASWVTLYSPLKVNRRFNGTCRLHLPGWRVSQAISHHKVGPKLKPGFLLGILFDPKDVSGVFSRKVYFIPEDITRRMHRCEIL
jgi:hypothetical protein